MLDTVFSSVRAQGKEWKDEASRRRTISESDPVADTLDHCARELDRVVLSLEQASEWLSPEDYGKQQIPAITGQTVRNWIKRGELKAEETAHGYRIARNAKPTRRLKIAS